MEKKEEILKKLKNTYCRLQPSKIAGIGVFAIRDIPKGINPFFGVREPEWAEFNIGNLKDLDEEILKMIDDFTVIEKDGSVFIPDCAFNTLDISFFVNNSSSPNMETNDGAFPFTTLRKIRKGEELTINYGTFDHKHKKK